MATRQNVAAYLDNHLSTVNAVVEDWCEFLGTDFEGNWKDSFDNCNVAVTIDML
jgi:hypothetical protein